MQSTKPANTQELVDHLGHVTYPVTGKQLMTACNNMSDVPSAQKNWAKSRISEDKTYNSKEELRRDLDI